MKVFMSRRRHPLPGISLLLTAAIFCAVNLPAAITTAAATRQLPIYCVDRSDNMASTSFDAARNDVIMRQPFD